MPRLYLHIWMAALLLLLGGCPLLTSTEDPEPRTAELRMAFMLELGQRILLESEDAVLEFTHNRVDARCPVNVDCFWEGHASILLEWTLGNQQPTLFSLTGYVAPEGGGTVSVDTVGYRFTLERLDPYPIYNPATDQVEQDGPVVATLRVDPL